MASGAIIQFRPNIGFAHESLTVSNSVQVLTPTKYADGDTEGGASTAFLSVEDGDIRYTYDGTTPSATVGHLLTSDSSIVLAGQNQISNFKCHRVGDLDAKVRITYERE